MQAGAGMRGNRDDATCRLRRRELLGTIKIAADKTEVVGSYYLGPCTDSTSQNALTWLSTLAQSFARYRVFRMRVSWVPFLGRMKDGSASYGIDWDGDAVKTFGSPAVAEVMALTPSVQGAAYERTSIALANNKLMSRQWYEIFDANDSTHPRQDCFPALCHFVVNSTGEDIKAEREVGALWLEYDLELQGARARAK